MPQEFAGPCGRADEARKRTSPDDESSELPRVSHRHEAPRQWTVVSPLPPMRGLRCNPVRKPRYSGVRSRAAKATHGGSPGYVEVRGRSTLRRSRCGAPNDSISKARVHQDEDPNPRTARRLVEPRLRMSLVHGQGSRRVRGCGSWERADGRGLCILVCRATSLGGVAADTTELGPGVHGAHDTTSPKEQ